MGQNLGQHAETWINRLLENGFQLEKFINIPDDTIHDKTGFLLDIAQTLWNPFDITTDLKELDLILPCWLLFALPRTPSFLLYALWESILRKNNVKIYQYLGLKNDTVIEKYLNEYINIPKLINSFKEVLDLSLTYDHVSTEKMISKVENIALFMKLSTIEGITEFFKNLCISGSIETGISGFQAIEDLSSKIKKFIGVEESINSFLVMLETIKENSKSDNLIQPIKVTEVVDEVYKNYTIEIKEEVKPIKNNQVEHIASPISVSPPKEKLDLTEYNDKIKGIEEKLESLTSLSTDQEINSVLDDLDISFINIKLKLERLLMQEEEKGNEEGKNQVSIILENLNKLEEIKFKLTKKVKKQNEIHSAIDILKDLDFSDIMDNEEY